MMPQTTYSCLFVLATLLCSFGCSAKAPTPINKPTDGAASNKNNESPTGGNMPVVPSNEMKPAQPEPIAWKPFSPPSGRYSVLLPDAAQALPSNRPTITNHGVSLPNGRIYMVSESPQSLFDHPDDVAEALAVARDAHLGDKQALFDEEVLLGDDIGRTYAYVDGDDVWEARIFLKRDRLYQLYAVVPKAEYVKGDPDVTRFLDSFRVVDPQENAEEAKP